MLKKRACLRCFASYSIKAGLGVVGWCGCWVVHGSRSWVVDRSGSRSGMVDGCWCRGRMIDGCRGRVDSGFVLRVLSDSLVFHIGHVATIASLENKIFCTIQFPF